MSLKLKTGKQIKLGTNPAIYFQGDFILIKNQGRAGCSILQYIYNFFHHPNPPFLEIGVKKYGN